MDRTGFATLLSTLWLAVVTAARGEILINEVLYDPAGPDEGEEFVEIVNTGPFAATLEGLTLEFGNGARPGDWKEIWEGRADRAIAPGALYRIGCDGPGQGEIAELRLQNADEGVRLMKAGYELDRVGWGSPIAPEYYEGSPVGRAKSGQSLARVRDGQDSDDNATDFEPAAPSPGRPNRPETDWAVHLDRPLPEVATPGDQVGLRLTLVHRGVRVATPPPVELLANGQSILVGFDEDLPPGSCIRATHLVPAGPDTGVLVVAARTRSSDPIPENDADTLAVRVGRAPLIITEILSAPDWGGEWIEVGVSGAFEGRRVDTLRLSAHNKSVRLGPRVLPAADERLLVVEDSLAFLARHPGVPIERLWRYEGSWPGLRDGDRRSAVADTVRIVAADGRALEWALPGPAPAPGVSLVRWSLDGPEGPGMWVPCPHASGSTPGDSDPSGRPAAGGLSVDPSAFRSGESAGCRISAQLGARPGTARLEIVDLRGRLARVLLHDVCVVGRVEATWDGTDERGADVEPGVYVAVLRVDEQGGTSKRARAAIAVAPRAE